VPLNHPGRDHERGRIWRIFYKGSEPSRPAVAPRKDWTTATVDQLSDDLADPNLKVRMIATDEIVDRIGKDAVEPLKAFFAAENAKDLQKVHAMWALHRLGALELDILSRAANDSSESLRVHAMRVLAETAPWTEQQRNLVIHATTDSNPLLQRCAADALARHPSPQNLRPLL